MYFKYYEHTYTLYTHHTFYFIMHSCYHYKPLLKQLYLIHIQLVSNFHPICIQLTLIHLSSNSLPTYIQLSPNLYPTHIQLINSYVMHMQLLIQ